ncbi:hypothetical protein B0H10DRAFT_1970069 [Mycena sp. CBHHK59/15]|nr:hypothetical protein B0H10DRAFT_1970069 [Mycena sp. CBHHK59/15]
MLCIRRGVQRARTRTRPAQRADPDLAPRKLRRRGHYVRDWYSEFALTRTRHRKQHSADAPPVVRVANRALARAITANTMVLAQLRGRATRRKHAQDADAARGTRKGNPSRGQTHPPEVGVTQTADTVQCAAHLHSCGIVHATWTPDSDAKCRNVCAIADGESVILNRCCLELQSREKNYKNREKSTVWSRWTCTWKRPVQVPRQPSENLARLGGFLHEAARGGMW